MRTLLLAGTMLAALTSQSLAQRKPVALAPVPRFALNDAEHPTAPPGIVNACGLRDLAVFRGTLAGAGISLGIVALVGMDGSSFSTLGVVVALAGIAGGGFLGGRIAGWDYDRRCS